MGRATGREEAGASMSQIFHPSMNTLSRLSIFGAAFVGLGS